MSTKFYMIRVVSRSQTVSYFSSTEPLTITNNINEAFHFACLEDVDDILYRIEKKLSQFGYIVDIVSNKKM